MTLTEQAGTTKVLIDTTGQEAGDYILTLESFNTLGEAKSALKTDTITITVVEAIIVAPSFVGDLEQSQLFISGVSTTWLLPEIDEGSSEL